ncbi:MAG TPA: energy transducer TonB [Chitinophagaceae bacterium]
MEAKKILAANILDILFENRNKEYGAYDLRNTYDSRINTALGITAFLIIIICSSAFIGNNATGSKNKKPIEISVAPITPDVEKKVILPPPPKFVKPQPIQAFIYTPPVIVIDNLVVTPPVENKTLDDARIDTKTVNGKIDDGLIPPVELKGNSAIEAPAKKGNMDQPPFTTVEIEAKFKGDWGAYVKKEIEKNMDELTEANESGTCIVRFVVSKDGSVSNVEAMTMKGSKLAEVAVNAIRKGPKWIPAMQNGTQVNAYRQQPITFKITE